MDVTASRVVRRPCDGVLRIVLPVAYTPSASRTWVGTYMAHAFDMFCNLKLRLVSDGALAGIIMFMQALLWL